MLVGHKQQWEFLKQALRNNRLPQAFIFSGEEKLGKKKTAFEFVKMVFCEKSKEAPCQVCQSCILVEKATHPDFTFIAPQKREIQVDQVRGLQKDINLKPVLSKIKAVIINDAHCLNIQAQNCILKTLEEPKSQTIFILISSLPNVLLGTIQSRCETIKFYPSKNKDVSLESQDSLKIAREFLTKNLLDKLLFIKELFPKNKEENDSSKETLSLLEGMIWHLRKALWQRADGEVKVSALLKTKKAIELTEEAKMLLQTTNVNPRLLLENLILNF